MLFSRADRSRRSRSSSSAHPVPLVVDPVMVASSGAKLLQDDAVETLVGRLFPLATVVTPNLPEAQALAGRRGHAARAGGAARRARRARRDRHRRPRRDAGRPPLRRRASTSRSRSSATTSRATHGAGCTHSATLAALLARGADAARGGRGAARAASCAVRHGLTELGAGDGPGRRPQREGSAMTPAPERRCGGCASASRSSTRSPTTSS